MTRVILPMFLSVSVLCACSASQAPSPGSLPAANPAKTAPGPSSGPPATLADWARGAKLFGGLGTFHRTVTTSSTEAQQYFDQGMRFLWAFNHDEATRSFAKAAALDPACAMCDWGVALTVGPNYNLPMMAESRASVAWQALGLAKEHAKTGTPVEQALITALEQRYPEPQPLDPSNSGPVLAAYANAMREVAARFPTDLDVQVLFAEALMNTNPWKLWSVDGKPGPVTLEVEATLERVLAKDPTHPGANHYYVHTMEASPHPEKALVAARRLDSMMPAAGHLDHMPAHIMQRIGDYEGASQANREGIKADTAYLGATQPLDYYRMYLAHNYQFLAYSAAMEGRRAEALDAAVKMRSTIPVDMLLESPGTDWYVSELYSTMIRFGMWDEILAESAPDPRLKGLTAGYHYARALAFAAKGQTIDATKALAELVKLQFALPPDAAAGLNAAKDVLGVASLVAQGEIALASGQGEDGVARLREAVAKEDQLAYDEPADWFVPVRHQLGAALMRMGRPNEAETVYREDLVRHPHNGWALFGLAQALRAQHKDAAAVDREFADAWKHADVKLTASVF